MGGIWLDIPMERLRNMPFVTVEQRERFREQTLCELFAVAEKMHELRTRTEKAEMQRDYLMRAATETLAENLHLADGDICTLRTLKRAVLLIDPNCELFADGST